MQANEKDGMRREPTSLVQSMDKKIGRRVHQWRRKKHGEWARGIGASKGLEDGWNSS